MFANQVGLKLVNCFERNTFGSLRNSHSKKLILRLVRVNIAQSSFFYSVVSIWDSWPAIVIEQRNSNVFFDLCKTQISAN